MIIKRYIVLFNDGDVECMCDVDNYKICPKRLRGSLECSDMMVSFVPVEDDNRISSDYIPGGGFVKTLDHCAKSDKKK